MASRFQLIQRKKDLYAALRLLEADREDGTIDPASYRVTRERYEHEAAEILEQLDGLEAERPASPALEKLSSRLVLVGSIGVAVTAAVIFLVAALHDRSTSTLSPTPTVTLPPAVARAQARVIAHPTSVPALLALGTSLMNAGDPQDADSAFRHAMSLAPANPEPRTMHAMILGSSGQLSRALAALHSVERAHPSYARAWLLDGLLSSRRSATRPHAIAAWKRFLRLEPTGPVARTVRDLLARAESAA